MIYVLELEGGNYYVGKTQNLTKRRQRHFEGKGNEWTKMHPPRKLIGAHIDIGEAGDDLEKLTTLAYMKKYGIDKVRGYAWSQRILTISSIESIKKTIFTPFSTPIL
jgi:predicted GIY-YIG superfamily endonuclease